MSEVYSDEDARIWLDYEGSKYIRSYADFYGITRSHAAALLLLKGWEAHEQDVSRISDLVDENQLDRSTVESIHRIAADRGVDPLVVYGDTLSRGIQELRSNPALLAEFERRLEEGKQKRCS